MAYTLIFLLKKNVSSFCICFEFSANQIFPLGLVDKRAESIRFLTAVVQALLGSHVGRPSSLYGWFFPGFSGFRPPLINDRPSIIEIFLKKL